MHLSPNTIVFPPMTMEALRQLIDNIQSAPIPPSQTQQNRFILLFAKYLTNQHSNYYALRREQHLWYNDLKESCDFAHVLINNRRVVKLFDVFNIDDICLVIFKESICQVLDRVSSARWYWDHLPWYRKLTRCQEISHFNRFEDERVNLEIEFDTAIKDLHLE